MSEDNAIHCAPTFVYSSRFIIYAPSFIFLDKWFLEKTPLNLDSYFVFQSLLKDEVVHFHSFFLFKEWLYEVEDDGWPVPAFTMPLPIPALTIPLPVNKFPNKLDPKVP